jgi:hypothetical protein
LKEFGSRSGLQLGRTWTTMIVAQVAMAVAGLPIAVGGFWGSITGAIDDDDVRDRPYLAAMISSDPEAAAGRRSRILSARLRDQSREAAGRSRLRESSVSRRSQTSRWREPFPETNPLRKSKSKASHHH